ncbi:hypothetical protein ACFZBU_39675 [Embleya sp. NPDC008237]|uniref:hypothetical protein n=1 Tax=Embleya sp. NPDC008237 TaxID=3363978 RepID=UPI0036E3F273
MSDNASEQPNPEPRPIAALPFALLSDGHVVRLIVPSDPRDCRWRRPATTQTTRTIPHHTGA